MDYCIAFFDQIYAKGGFYDREVSPDALRRLERERPERVSYLGEVFPSASYLRADAEGIRASDEKFRTRQDGLFREVNATRPTAAASIALTIDNCFIQDSVIHVPVGRRLEAFYTTYRQCDRPYAKPLGKSLAQSAIFRIAPRGRRVLFLGSPGSRNYGHWLIDDLPRLRFLRESREPTVLLLQSCPGTDDWRRKMVDLFARDCETDIVFIPPGRMVHCRELTYVTPVSFHPSVKNPHALDFVRNLAAGQHAPRDRKLFVTRAAKHVRQIENLPEVRELLARTGFSVIEPESLTFEEQISAFAAACEIVGIMGAGMCNTVFADRGTRITYLAPEGWVEPFYWDLASLLGHRYGVVYGERAHRNHAPHLDDFTVDIDALHGALSS